MEIFKLACSEKGKSQKPHFSSLWKSLISEVTYKKANPSPVLRRLSQNIFQLFEMILKKKKRKKENRSEEYRYKNEKKIISSASIFWDNTGNDTGDINIYNLVISCVNLVNMLFSPQLQLIKKDRSDLTMVSMVLVITLS